MVKRLVPKTKRVGKKTYYLVGSGLETKRAAQQGVRDIKSVATKDAMSCRVLRTTGDKYGVYCRINVG